MRIIFIIAYSSTTRLVSSSFYFNVSRVIFINSSPYYYVYTSHSYTKCRVDEMSVDEMSSRRNVCRRNVCRRSVVDEMSVDELSWNHYRDGAVCLNLG